MNHVLDELDKGHDVHAVDAALKRHEAISADIQAGVCTIDDHYIRILSLEYIQIGFECVQFQLTMNEKKSIPIFVMNWYLTNSSLVEILS